MTLEAGHPAVPAPDVDEDRWFIVVVRDRDGSLSALSRQMAGPDGRPFTGPWGLLTQDEADQIAQLWNDDPGEGGTRPRWWRRWRRAGLAGWHESRGDLISGRADGGATTVEVFRYDLDPE
jgi:hypothetical protein